MPQSIHVADPGANLDADDELESNDLEVGEQIFPLGQSVEPQDGDTEIELGDWAEELNQVADDDGEGPLDGSDTDFFVLDSQDAGDDDQIDESSQAEVSLLGDQLPQPEAFNDELDELEESKGPDYRSRFNDAEISWSAQPWCERPMVRAFAPCAALTGRGNLVIATGDSTSVLDTETFQTVAEAPLHRRASSAVLLDDQAEQVLITTGTGQLLLWTRSLSSLRPQRMDDGHELDCVDRICESTPGSNEVWALHSGGSVCYRTADAEHFRRYNSRETYLSIATGESALVAVTRDRRLVRLSTSAATTLSGVRLPEGDNSDALAKRAVIAVSKSMIAVGAREFGAWLSSDAGLSFSEIPGCQNITACAFGTYGGRSYLWVALFRELEDKTDLVAVECKTKRAQRLASFTVVTDCPGPEDDPPERARIDGLYWDSAHQRLWAAGCSGITCFEPPQSSQATS